MLFWMFFCEKYCNIAMQCCNIDVQLREHSALCLWWNLTLAFNVYYKIEGKFVPQARNIDIFN